MCTKSIHKKCKIEMMIMIIIKVKIKQSHYRPGQVLRIPGGWGSQISRQWAHEGGKLVSPKHRPPLPQKTFMVLISVRGWVDPRAMVRPEGLCQWKIRMTQSRIERANFGVVAKCLNQLRHQRRVPIMKVRSFIMVLPNSKHCVGDEQI
jgi:hypothetical protein